MEKKKCEVEVFARVTGFFRPVSEMNVGKQAEIKDRKKYDIHGLEKKEKEKKA